jgi:hypothetical protein
MLKRIGADMFLIKNKINISKIVYYPFLCFFKSVIILFIGMFFIVGCSRPQINSSTLNLSFPKAIEKLSNEKAIQGFSDSNQFILAHIVLNISGPDINPIIVTNYDACENCDSTAQTVGLSHNISIEIPSGNSRLIQILAVYKDTLSENGEFYYGDSISDIHSPEVNLYLPISHVGGGSLAGGVIAGRYLDSLNSGPTGLVEIRYQPLNRPFMTIENALITAGWFNFFILPDINFDYVLTDTGQNLFSDASLNSPQFLITSPSVIRVSTPSHWESWNQSNTTDGKIREASTAIIGFFGPGATDTNTICYKSSHTFSRLKKTSDHTSSLLYLDSTDTTQSVQITGGASCSQPPPESESFVSKLYFDPNNLENGGHEGSAGFRGIFRLTQQSALTITPSNTDISAPSSAIDLNFGFNLLPDTAESVSSVGIYYRSYAEPRDYEVNHQPDCDGIENSSYGFVHVNTVTISAGIQSYSFTKNSSEIAGFGSVQSSSIFILCPHRSDNALS